MNNFGTHHQPVGNVMGCKSLGEKCPTQCASRTTARPDRPSLSDVRHGHVAGSIVQTARMTFRMRKAAK